MNAEVKIKDDGLSNLEKQRAEIDRQIREQREKRMTAIGRIFERQGLGELSDELFYGIADELKAAGLNSPRLVELARKGAEVAPKKPGRKTQAE